MVPGIVLGAISLVGFLLMLIWICVRFCRRRRLARAREQEPLMGGGGPGEQFLTSAGGYSPTTPQLNVGRRRKASDVLTGLMVVVGLACLGIASWGMAESIRATDTVIVNFWDIVHEIQNLTDFSAVQFQAISYSLTQIDSGLVTLANQSQVVQPALESLAAQAGLDRGMVGQVIDAAQGEVQSGKLLDIATTLNDTSIKVLKKDIGQAIRDVLHLESPTMSIQDTWRYVVFAVLFGLVILFVILATAACFWMRFGRWASLLVSLVWLLSVVINLVGLGLLTGIQSVAEDACLYTESFIYRDVVTKINNKNVQKLVITGMDYYFNVTSLPGIVNDTVSANVDVLACAMFTSSMTSEDDMLDGVQVGGALLGTLTAQNWTQALDLVQEVNSTANAVLASPAVNTTLGLLPDSIEGAVRTLLSGAGGMLGSTLDLVKALLRSNVGPLYRDFKRYLCCNVHTTARHVWIPWVVVGVLLIVYCLLASARVIWQTVNPQDYGCPGEASFVVGDGGLGGGIAARHSSSIGDKWSVRKLDEGGGDPDGGLRAVPGAYQA
ncbi:hypothetical protein N2152v2_000458 [Parachlorella kessleri]